VDLGPGQRQILRLLGFGGRLAFIPPVAGFGSLLPFKSTLMSVFTFLKTINF